MFWCWLTPFVPVDAAESVHLFGQHSRCSLDMLDRGGWAESHQRLRTVKRRDAFQFLNAQRRIHQLNLIESLASKFRAPSIARLVNKWSKSYGKFMAGTVHPFLAQEFSCWQIWNET